MSRQVVTISCQTSPRDAARRLLGAGAGWAALVDSQGDCVGVLTAADFLRWAAEDLPETLPGRPAPCPYQVRGRPLGGQQEEAICTRAAGSCLLQVVRPTTGGRHVALCSRSEGPYSDWQHVGEGAAGGHGWRLCEADVVRVGPRTALPELARAMSQARATLALVLDGQGRPVGAVTSTDVLAALTAEAAREDPKDRTLDGE